MRNWIAVALVWAAFLPGLAVVPASAEEVGVVVEAQGTVAVVRGAAEISAVSGTPVELNDLVRTGRPGLARLVFHDETVMTVSESSSVQVDESVVASPGSGASVFSLLVGKVRLLVSEYYGESGASLQVKTPTSVSGVRGTEFIVAHSLDTGSTEILALEGSVQVRSVVDLAGPGVLLRAGEMTVVAEGALPTPPRKAQSGEESELGAGLGIGGRGLRDDRGGTGTDAGEADRPEAGIRVDSSASEGATEPDDSAAQPPGFPGDGPPSTPSDLLGEPAPVLGQDPGIGVGF